VLGAEPSPGKAHTPRGPQVYAPAFVSPSSPAAEGDLAVGSSPEDEGSQQEGGHRGARSPEVLSEPQTIGERMQLALDGDASMRHLGDALHTFLAADPAESQAAARRAMAAGCLARFDVAGALQPDEMVRASDALGAWVARITTPAPVGAGSGPSSTASQAARSYAVSPTSSSRPRPASSSSTTRASPATAPRPSNAPPPTPRSSAPTRKH